MMLTGRSAKIPRRSLMQSIEFGWYVTSEGLPESGNVPLVIEQEPIILPVVAQHFTSFWIEDHFYGFYERTNAWVECWTTLAWLAARFPTVRVGTIVLCVG